MTTHVEFSKERDNDFCEDQFDCFPLTPAQRSLYLFQKPHPENPAFNLGLGCEIRGDVDVKRLQWAIESVLNSASVFSTIFVNSSKRDIMQADEGDDDIRTYAKIYKAARHSVPVHKIPAENADAERAFVMQAYEQAIETPFAPGTWPQGYVALYQGADCVYLTCVCSHLVADAHSVSILFDTFAQMYADDKALPRLSAQLADHPALLVKKTRAEQQAYDMYAKLFESFGANSHAEGVLTPQPSDQASTVIEALPVSLVDGVNAGQGAARHGVFPLLMASYLLTLSALTGVDELVVGLPVAARIGKRAKVSLGYFVHTNPLPVNLAQFSSLDELCQWLSSTVFGMVRYRDFDFWAHAADLVPNLMQCPPVLTNAFTFYDRNVSFTLPGTQINLFPSAHRHLKYPFSANVAQNENGYTLTIECAERFLAAQPEKIYLNATHTLLNTPAYNPLKVNLLTGQLTEVAHSSIKAQVASKVHGTLCEHLQHIARQYPNQTALEDNQHSLSYSALYQRVDELGQQIAHKIPGQYVGVSFQPCVDAIVAILAILRAGKAYVPLDPNAPSTRLAHILKVIEETAPTGLYILADHHNFPASSNCQIMSLPELGKCEPLAVQTPIQISDESSPAYVIFTSGSTGEPKGVSIGHGNVLRLLQTAIPDTGIQAGDRWCLFHSMAFDFSVWEIFGPLLTGGTLMLPSQQIVADPLAFLDFLKTSRINILNQTPTAFRRLLTSLAVRPMSLPALRCVIFGGESLEANMLDDWWKQFGQQVRMINMYGITEITVHGTSYAIPPDSPLKSRSIIGRPLADLGMSVVDRHLRPMPLGCAGELIIWGPGLAQCYLNRPQLTATRFVRGTELAGVVYRSGDKVRLLADGELEYLGRLDRQVQLRGYRIELGEVETALRAHPSVRDVIVKVISDGEYEAMLAAWIIPATADFSKVQLQSAMASSLPVYMRPAALIMVKAFPMTVNGKIDETALPHPAKPPRLPQLSTEMSREQHIALLFAQVLGVEHIGVNERFFDVGGTSMHLLILLSKVSATFSLPSLSVMDLFEHPTARSLAQHIETISAELNASAQHATTPRAQRQRPGYRPQRSQSLSELHKYWQ
ncbi:non-ribosomal peptide synthetase [Serratia aquatilis]|uniref:Amino acid adenylation domain-containing protein n=1 Tax=Serratia aquatilis TaxID=1737515 RepID=A0ABV6EF92_9GAMM